jgi:hypothetical protein
MQVVADIIIWLCLFYEPKGCTINIYRETYNEFKQLYTMTDLRTPNKFHDAEESFKIGNLKYILLVTVNTWGWITHSLMR